MARYWSQDAENYGNIIEGELSSFRVGAGMTEISVTPVWAREKIRQAFCRRVP